jgi:hypothetical protein
MPGRLALYAWGMSTKSTKPARLSEMPLWRLLVALDDAERVAGPDSSTARTLAQAVADRLRGRRDDADADSEPAPCLTTSH